MTLKTDVDPPNWKREETVGSKLFMKGGDTQMKDKKNDFDSGKETLQLIDVNHGLLTEQSQQGLSLTVDWTVPARIWHGIRLEKCVLSAS